MKKVPDGLGQKPSNGQEARLGVAGCMSLVHGGAKIDGCVSTLMDCEAARWTGEVRRDRGAPI